nr:immunoglobulin light chain junction region [Macaca mulatta]MOX43638.1 immunoglobulin light chain junction region [Macaca mulatta]MOX46329.1 immunoglobulin light chain junction region [Macaca mulatta]MOX46727.1 immunoglobulin light chain junction region [Macaca mulatta]MOX47152.1 immunoglobulin light chain junction region [Macaca mulatta]
DYYCGSWDSSLTIVLF